MVSIPIPIMLALTGAVFWPYTLMVAVVLALVGLVVNRPWLRWVYFVQAGVLAADCLLALWMPGEN